MAFWSWSTPSTSSETAAWASARDGIFPSRASVKIRLAEPTASW